MSRGVSWLQGAEVQSAFSSCWKLSLLQSGTQQLLKAAVAGAGETRSGVKAGEGWTLHELLQEFCESQLVGS